MLHSSDSMSLFGALRVTPLWLFIIEKDGKLYKYHLLSLWSTLEPPPTFFELLVTILKLLPDYSNDVNQTKIR